MTKFEVMLQKLQKCKKIDYMVRAGRPISWPKTPILNFLMSRSSHVPFKNLEVDFRKFWAKTNDQNWSYTPKSVKIYQNQQKVAKIYPFWTKKIPNFEFSHRCHYSYTLEDTYENILGSLQPKIMTKFEVMSEKLSKNSQNLPLSDKKTQILNFSTGITTHTP